MLAFSQVLSKEKRPHAIKMIRRLAAVFCVDVDSIAKETARTVIEKRKKKANGYEAIAPGNFLPRWEERERSPTPLVRRKSVARVQLHPCTREPGPCRW